MEALGKVPRTTNKGHKDLWSSQWTGHSETVQEPRVQQEEPGIRCTWAAKGVKAQAFFCLGFFPRGTNSSCYAVTAP